MKKILCALFSVLLLCSLPGCASSAKPEDDRTVLTVDGTKVTYDEFRYIYLNSKSDLDGGDSSVWENNPELTEKLNAEVIRTLRQNAAVHKMAKKYNISLTKDEKKEVEDEIEAFKASCTDESSYEKALNEANLSEYALREMKLLSRLWSKLYSHVTSEASFIIRADDQALLDDIPKNFLRATQILIKSDPDKSDEELRATANEALEKARQGEDFDALIKEYGEDPSLTDNPDGYYFTDGELLAYFEDTAKELEIGEISDVVPCVYGYSIIKRLPLEDSYIKKHLEDLRKSFVARSFNEMLQEYTDQITYQTTQLYYELIQNGMS